MKCIKNLMFLSLALLLLPIVAFAQETSVAQDNLPLWINEAKIDGTTIYPFDWTKLNLERGSEIELKFYLESMDDVQDVEIDAFISGYEYNHDERIAGHISLFDMDANTIYVKKMKITLPEDLNVNEYKLRVVISDRYRFEQIYSYNLDIDSPRHELKLKDVLLNPNKDVMAGAGFVAKVRLENSGQRDEKDIKVTVGLPELSIQSSEYVDKIKADDEKDSEEIFIRLPRCAVAGEYVVAVEVIYNKGHSKIAGFTKLNVLENPQCNIAKDEESQQIQIIVPQEPKEPLASEAQEAPVKTSKSMRTILEISLIVLVALLIIVGFAIGVSKWRKEE